MLLFNYGPGEHSQFSDLLRAGWSRDRILVGHCYYMSFFKCYFLTMCRESVISLATRYGLDGPGIESWWGVRFSAPVHTSHGAHPAFYTMGTVSLPRLTLRPLSPEESYRLCCVVVCDLETSRMGAPYIYDISSLRVNNLTLILLMWRKWWSPNNASK